MPSTKGMKMTMIIKTAVLTILLVGAAWGQGFGKPAYNTVQEEGSSLAQRQTLNFTGSGITCTDATPKTVCDVPGATGGASVTVDTFANIAGSSPADGTIGYTTDSFYTSIVRSSGAWRYFLLGREMFPAVPASYTVDNAATTTQSTTNGSITLGSTQNNLALTAYYAAIPGSAFTVTVHTLYHGPQGGNGYCFLAVGDNAGAYSVFLIDPSSNNFYNSLWASSTSFAGAGAFGAVPGLQASSSARGAWLRITESGGTRSFQTSGDGNTWINVGTQATGTYVTTTRYAFGLNTAGGYNRACTFTSVEAQ